MATAVPCTRRAAPRQERPWGAELAAGFTAHLKTARWVCSRSSPFTMQENSPKDSVPGAEGGGITLGSP